MPLPIGGHRPPKSSDPEPQPPRAASSCPLGAHGGSLSELPPRTGATEDRDGAFATLSMTQPRRRAGGVAVQLELEIAHFDDATGSDHAAAAH